LAHHAINQPTFAGQRYLVKKSVDANGAS
jgi:hypothetical protein